MTELSIDASDPHAESSDGAPRWLGAPRLGLRARITMAFMLSSVLLATLMAATTWGLTRENIVDQRESSVTRQAFRNAELVSAELGTQPTAESLSQPLPVMKGETASQSLLIRDGQTNQTSAAYGRSAVPTSMMRMVRSGDAARMRVSINGQPELVIGIPLEPPEAYYFEFVSLADTQSTLESLSAALIGATLVTGLVGAGLGWWASRRALRPLAEVSTAAEAIAGGRLDTRLESIGDPDLGVLVSSFNHMAQVLEARIDHDGRFASDVSHELRSPLMTLSASIEVLLSRRDEMPDESARAALDLMVADVARFKQLVEDLLEISRFDAGAARLELSELRPAQLATQSVGWSQSPEVPIELDSELAGVVIRADKRRLMRVITNLLDNARKYGGGATRLELLRLPGALLIAVEDGGPGIPADERELIFERFSRGTGSKKRGGSEGVGLGLSLVAEHIALHDGRVWVEDRPDGEPGARFVIELPVAWDRMLDEDDEEMGP